MVVDFVVDQTQTMWYMALAGLVVALVGVQGVMNPDTWVLASAPVGQVFNVLPNVVHQALGGLFVLGGVTQVGEALDLY